MISLIWPYWERQAVADQSCGLLAQHYAGMSIELIVADDGNRVPYQAPAMPFPVRVVTLPRKDIALNPCVPINAGVRAASGDVLVLTNPEILHRKPILQAMRAELGASRAKYVQAAVIHHKAPGVSRWHSHSTVAGKVESGIRMPKGACYHFCAMLHRDLFDAAGGFDEDYRHGAGYDDPDFVLRLQRAGAEFVMRDDLVVEHVRSGAHAKWPNGAFARNEQIFKRKWA